MNNLPMRRVRLLSAFALLLFPTVVLADSGISLLSITRLHGTLATLFIGLGEGLLLALVFRLKIWRSIGLLVLANYVSWLAGGILAEIMGSHFEAPSATPPLYRLADIVIAPWVVMFVATLFVEWPFCWRALLPKPGRWRKSVVATLILQVVSYSVLVPWFCQAGLIGLYRNLTVDKSLAAELPTSTTIFYLSPEGREVRRLSLPSLSSERVCSIQTNTESCRLFVRPSTVAGSWDLWIHEGYLQNSDRLIAANVGRRAAQWRSSYDPGEADVYNDRQWGPAADFRPEAERKWIVETWMLEDRGLWLRNTETGEEITTGLNTPQASWEARNATVLPGDIVVYELHGQIVVLDIPTRRIGFIAMGRSPVVILPDTKPPASQTTSP